MDFGLSDEDVWAAVNEVCAQVPAAKPAEASVE
jgi:hypothetical protein